MKKTEMICRIAGFCLALLLLLSSFVGCTVDYGGGTDTTAPADSESNTAEGTETDGESTEAESTTEGGGGAAPAPVGWFISKPDLSFTYEKETEVQYELRLTELAEAIAAEAMPDEELLSAYHALEELLYQLREGTNLLYVASCLYRTDEEIAEELLSAQSFYNSASQRFVELHGGIADSRYRAAIFDGWSEEEILLVVEMAKAYDETYVALQNRIDALRQEWRELPEWEGVSRGAELYRELVSVGTDLARHLGYDGFMEYVYAESYEREYTVSDAKQLTESATAELIPLMELAVERLSNIALSARDLSELHTLLYGSFETPRVREILDGYYAALGGDIYEAYCSFWEDGYYFIAYDDALSEARAYTLYLDVEKAPAIYFGPGYMDAFTFVHEFGHYYNYSKNGGEEALSYDLAEAQSQGDEWLFLAYLCEEVYGGTNAAPYLEYYRLANDLLSFTVCLTVNEFERQASLDGGKAAAEYDLDLLYREAADTVWDYDSLAALMGYPPENYWRLVAIEQSGYYVSYAVSLVPAIELYTLATKDFAGAAAIYEKMQVSGGFLEALEGAGLGSPFEKAVYERISEAFEY